MAQDDRHVTRSDTQGTATNTAAQLPDVKKLEKLRKLEAWKKKQAERKKSKEQQKQAIPIPVPQKKTAAVLKRPLNGTTKKPVIKNVFGDAEEGDETIQKKARFIPKLDDDVMQREDVIMDDEEDPLDAFMNILDGGDGDTPGRVADALLEEDDAIEGADLEDVDDNSEATKLLKKLKTKKTKELNAPKYKLSDLEPIKKSFLFDMESIDPDEAINFQVMNNIFISDKKISPVMNFYHFGLDAETLSVIINDFQFDAPTPIQSQTIPAIMSGNDVIGIGKTGSGKTMCYLLSMFKHIKQQRPLQRGDTGPIGVILSPTRELAIQIHEACYKFLKSSVIKAICCTGGSELQKQINEIKKGVEIIVATPGRFIDLLTLNNGKLLKTDRISFVTLDEADRLFDLGFEPQINQIMKTIRPDKQCVLFSATFPSKLQSFAVKILRKPIIIAIGNKQVVNENITQLAKIVNTEEEKFHYLLNLLGKQSDQKTIIFCESQLQVDFMSRRLLDSGYSPIYIHAGLPANERAANLQKFKKDPEANILLCTEVLSRGLDVPEVSLVVLYNAARSFAQYVHTTGRTARGNTKGTAISLLSVKEDLQAYILYKCMKEEEIPDDIRNIAVQFEGELQQGKKKISAGYGGKGLDHLDRLRDVAEKKEKQQYAEEAKSATIEEENELEEDIKDPNLDIVYNVPSESVDKGDFNAKININDLPQDIRWIASNNATLSKIIEQTSVSVTYKGRYYPEGKEPHEGDEPKLYLLVEATKEQQLFDAIDLFKSIVVSGLKKATQDRSGKFSM
jgi:ATP-dependent RNA helicase DDX46/PRP5